MLKICNGCWFGTDAESGPQDSQGRSHSTLAKSQWAETHFIRIREIQLSIDIISELGEKENPVSTFKTWIPQLWMYKNSMWKKKHFMSGQNRMSYNVVPLEVSKS